MKHYHTYQVFDSTDKLVINTRIKAEKEMKRSADFTARTISTRTIKHEAPGVVGLGRNEEHEIMSRKLDSLIAECKAAMEGNDTVVKDVVRLWNANDALCAYIKTPTEPSLMWDEAIDWAINTSATLAGIGFKFSEED